jgi:hypothetical protein
LCDRRIESLAPDVYPNAGDAAALIESSTSGEVVSSTQATPRAVLSRRNSRLGRSTLAGRERGRQGPAPRDGAAEAANDGLIRPALFKSLI